MSLVLPRTAERWPAELEQRRLAEMTAEESAPLGLFVLLCAVSGLILVNGGPVWLVVGLPTLALAWHVVHEVLWNPLEEPRVRLSSDVFEPGRTLFVECELRPKRKATVREIVAEFESVEGYGEDATRTRHGEWLCDVRAHLSTSPLVVRHSVSAPVPPAGQASRMRWFLKVNIDLARGPTIRRRYALAEGDRS